MKKLLLALLFTFVTVSTAQAGTTLSWEITYPESTDVESYSFYLPNESDLSQGRQGYFEWSDRISTHNSYLGLAMPMPGVLTGLAFSDPSMVPDSSFGMVWLDSSSILEDEVWRGEYSLEFSTSELFRDDEDRYGSQHIALRKKYDREYSASVGYDDIWGLLQVGDVFEGEASEELTYYNPYSRDPRGGTYNFTAKLVAIGQDQSPVPTPEPSSFLLIGMGLLVLFGVRKKVA
jgi:hypothetical protein